MEADLELDVTWYPEFVCCGVPRNKKSVLYKDHNDDKQAARRYASVLAAAEIGRGME